MTVLDGNPADDRPPADLAERVLPDNARLVRWAAPLFAGCAAILLPWIVIAGITLPSDRCRVTTTWPGPATTCCCCSGW